MAVSVIRKPAQTAEKRLLFPRLWYIVNYILLCGLFILQSKSPQRVLGFPDAHFGNGLPSGTNEDRKYCVKLTLTAAECLPEDLQTHSATVKIPFMPGSMERLSEGSVTAMQRDSNEKGDLHHGEEH